ncbi:hypothetical protein Q8F55_004529 [Vanrija albida]|uniref:Uncharacterized protein n=1 Tax=Vanrija albida TaxID=181172 RepID=A0ABR3Q702_9TREE
MRLHLSLGLIALVLARAAAAVPLPTDSHPPHGRQLTTTAALAALQETLDLRVYSPAAGEYFLIDYATGRFWAVAGALRDAFLHDAPVNELRVPVENDQRVPDSLLSDSAAQKPLMAA